MTTIVLCVLLKSSSPFISEDFFFPSLLCFISLTPFFVMLALPTNRKRASVDSFVSPYFPFCAYVLSYFFMCVFMCVCLFVLCSFHFFEQVTSPPTVCRIHPTCP